MYEVCIRMFLPYMFSPYIFRMFSPYIFCSTLSTTYYYPLSPPCLSTNYMALHYSTVLHSPLFNFSTL